MAVAGASTAHPGQVLPSPAPSPPAPPPRSQILGAYAVLYLVWGSTYLAMKLAVATLPAFTTAALRFVFSGLLLLVIGRLLDKTPLTLKQVWASMASGLFLLVFGNAAVMVAMKTVPSGVGALVIATTPLFMALLGRDFRAITWVGIALGLVGIAVLVDPLPLIAAALGMAPDAGQAASTRVVPPAGVLLLVFAAASWAIGSLMPRKWPPHPSNAIATGVQMLTGAVVQFTIGQAMGERVVLAETTTTSWLALLYLAVFGSLVGFTCYGWLLKVEPASRVATYAYVNPVVAVLLGALLGGEEIGPRVLVAAAIIVVAVVLILRSRQR